VKFQQEILKVNLVKKYASSRCTDKLILKDRQCTYNTTFRRFHETAAAVEKQKVLNCSVCAWEITRACVRPSVRPCWCGCTGASVYLRPCSLNYPACHAQVPYCLRPSWLHHIFQHYLINCATENKMCVLLFTATFIWSISHSKKNSARYCHKCENVFIQSTRFLYWILKVLEFSRQIFEKVSNVKFNQNPSNGSRDVPCGRTDGHYEANSRFSQFCERA
jgi:hypothetical protein